jgi:hypothetical protein
MLCKINRIAAMALASGALVACGGGSSGTPGSPTPAGGSPASSQRYTVALSLFVPKVKSTAAGSVVSQRGARRLSPLYVPTSINSVSIQQTESAGAVVSGAPVTVLVVGSSNCTASAGGQTCTATLQGALGQDAWAIKSYVTGNGTGTAVSLNTGTLTVLSGVANVLSLTLNPVLASLTFVPVAYSANATATSTLPLVLQAKDTAGAIIIGPGTYVTAANVANPIALSSSSSHVALQTSGGTAATATLTTTGTNDLAQLAYDGTLVAGSQAITASATGITTATLALTLTLAAGGLSVPTSIALGEDLSTTSTTLAISEPGYGGSFTLTSSSCAGIVSFPASAGPGPTSSPTVTQIGGGTCTILVADGTNMSSVIVYSTTLGIVLQ